MRAKLLRNLAVPLLVPLLALLVGVAHAIPAYPAPSYPIAGLERDVATGGAWATISFAAPASAPMNKPLEWTFSGCDPDKTEATGYGSVIVKFSSPGEVTWTCTMYWMGDGQQHSHTASGTCWIIGGMFMGSSDHPGSKREQRTNVPEPQPWVLTYYGTGEQPRAILTCRLVADYETQPDGTDVQWVRSGNIEFTEAPTQTRCKVRAIGPSVRGGAGVSALFSLEKEVNGQVYSLTVQDCTNPPVRAISCHVPAQIVDRSGNAIPDVLVVGPPTWNVGQRFFLGLRSHLGDPMDGVDVQERFDPVPTEFDDGSPLAGFHWNGSTNVSWRTGGMTRLGNWDGYKIHADFADDLLSGGWTPLGQPTLPKVFMTWTHTYWAGTKVSTNGGPGILVGSFTARFTATQSGGAVTHTP